MSAAIITRPQCEINFTTLPNDLFNFGHHCDLKPRDMSVLTHLLSKPEQWNINPKAIANALNMGESTARRALTALKDKGFASFERFADGRRKWQIKLPETLVKSPQSQKPHVKKPHVQNGDVLITNDLLEKNEKTTNAVVVSLPDYVNQPVAKQALSKLEATQQTLVLAILTAAMTKGLIKSPVVYLLGLIKKATAGCLDASGVVDKAGVKAVDKRKIAFIQRNFEKLKKQLEGVERINIAHSSFDGFIYAKDLEEFENGRN